MDDLSCKAHLKTYFQHWKKQAFRQYQPVLVEISRHLDQQSRVPPSWNWRDEGSSMRRWIRPDTAALRSERSENRAARSAWTCTSSSPCNPGAGNCRRNFFAPCVSSWSSPHEIDFLSLMRWYYLLNEDKKQFSRWWILQNRMHLYQYIFLRTQFYSFLRIWILHGSIFTMLGQWKRSTSKHRIRVG